MKSIGIDDDDFSKMNLLIRNVNITYGLIFKMNCYRILVLSTFSELLVVGGIAISKFSHLESESISLNRMT